MKFKIIYQIIFLLVYSFSFGQTYKSLAVIGHFNQASGFSVTASGNIYITDSGTNEIYKLDTLGNVVNYIGGYGWDSSSFDNPTDIYSTPLQSYIADKNNHRIQVFDKNLNFLYEFSTEDLENQDADFRYPVSVAVSSQGDLYLLDSDNQRVLKFDLTGNLVLEFGNYDYGIYSLDNPKRLVTSKNGNVFVADKNKLVVFDQFGTGISNIKTPVDPANLNALFNNLVVNDDNSIYSLNLNSNDWKFIRMIPKEKFVEKIVEASIFNNKLYVLTEKNIHIFIKQ